MPSKLRHTQVRVRHFSATNTKDVVKLAQTCADSSIVRETKYLGVSLSQVSNLDQFVTGLSEFRALKGLRFYESVGPIEPLIRLMSIRMRMPARVDFFNMNLNDKLALTLANSNIKKLCLYSSRGYRPEELKRFLHFFVNSTCKEFLMTVGPGADTRYFQELGELLLILRVKALGLDFPDVSANCVSALVRSLGLSLSLEALLFKRLTLDALDVVAQILNMTLPFNLRFLGFGMFFSWNKQFDYTATKDAQTLRDTWDRVTRSRLVKQVLQASCSLYVFDEEVRLAKDNPWA